MPSAPASSSFRYASVNCDGAGRDVLTIERRALSARATSAGSICSPSRPSMPLITTVRGTTVRLYEPLSSAGRYAVESVTTATGMRGTLTDAWPGAAAGRDQAGRDQAGRHQAGRDQARDQAGRDQAGRDQAGRDQAGRNQARDQ